MTHYSDQGSPWAGDGPVRRQRPRKSAIPKQTRRQTRSSALLPADDDRQYDARLTCPAFTPKLSSMRAFGRILQHLGLLVAPLAVFLQLGEAIDARQLLAFGVAALCLFWIGRLIEGYAKG